MIMGGRAKNLGHKPDKKQQTFNIYWPKTPDAVVQLTLILAPDVPQLSKREVVFGDLSFFGVGTESHGFR